MVRSIGQDQGSATIVTPVGRETWQKSYEASPLRDADFTTMSGVPLKAVYGPEDLAPEAEAQGSGQYPGQYPYARGIHASMYRTKLWTTRMFAGFGTAIDTNERFCQLLDDGSEGLSTAFDVPTLMGLDSDDPMSMGEVGKCGVAIDTLADVQDLYRGIDLAEVTTSMTINSPAAILLAMYVASAELTGTPRRLLGGTLQNDILKEYQAQKEFIFPPRPSLRLVADTMKFCAAEMPRWNALSVSGYHIREAGSTAAQELAFTLANGFAYVETGVGTGLAVDDFAPRLSFFFNAHLDFFEEIAKYRAARRIWARWLRDRYGAVDERSLKLRFHTQTSGASLTATQPEVNIVRTAIEALAGIMGGTQSLHTNAMDEALALPTEKAARVAVRTQQVLAHEIGVAHVADPLGGSWFVEALTDEIEAQAEAIFRHIEEMGSGSMLEGVLGGIEDGWFQREISNAAYDYGRRIENGRNIIVGVNQFTGGNEEDPIPILQIGPECEQEQLRRLKAVREGRDDRAVRDALASLRQAAEDPSTNLMPVLIDVVRTYATVGEVVTSLADVFGRWREVPEF